MKILLKNIWNKGKAKTPHLSPTQTIVLGFALFILLGACLLNLPLVTRSGHSVGFTNALFTSTSAVCVTGLVVVDTNTTFNLFGQIVIIGLIQLGGLGIMFLSTMFSLLIGRRMGLKERLTIQESINLTTLSGVVRILTKILIAALVIEGIGALILSTRLIPLFGVSSGIFKSIFHAVSSFCNAGFDIFGSPGKEYVSLIPFQNDPVIVLTIGFLIIIGGLGFIVWRNVGKVKKPSQYMLHTKLVLIMTTALIVIGTLLILLFEYQNPHTLKLLPWPEKLWNAFFQAVTPRTAGFNSVNIADMTIPSRFLTILLMFIGAAPGSTGGGIKVTTFFVILLVVLSNIKGQEEVSAFSRRIPFSVIQKSLSIFFTSMLIVIVTTMVLLIYQEGPFIDVLYEATSAFGTVGLTAGITPHLHTVSKYQIILTMFLGRVGPLSAAIALSFHHSNKQKPYSYPEGKINVG